MHLSYAHIFCGPVSSYILLVHNAWFWHVRFNILNSLITNGRYLQFLLIKTFSYVIQWYNKSIFNLTSYKKNTLCLTCLSILISGKYNWQICTCGIVVDKNILLVRPLDITFKLLRYLLWSGQLLVFSYNNMLLT